MRPSGKWISAGAAALVLGAGLAWLTWSRPAPPASAPSTDAIEARIDELARAVQDARGKAQQKVVIIREEIQKEVAALPADGVAAGLDAELALWRSRDVGPRGVASP